MFRVSVLWPGSKKFILAVVSWLIEACSPVSIRAVDRCGRAKALSCPHASQPKGLQSSALSASVQC